MHSTTTASLLGIHKWGIDWHPVSGNFPQEIFKKGVYSEILRKSPISGMLVTGSTSKKVSGKTVKSHFQR
jgi:hypothetical protein